MGRDSLVDRNGLGNASPWDARRAAPTGDRGPQPPARFGDFPAVKSPPPEAGERQPARTRRPDCWEQPHRKHLSVALRPPPLLKEML